MIAVSRARLLAASQVWSTLGTRAAGALAPNHFRPLSGAAGDAEPPSKPQVPKKARPMPNQKEVRRQMVAYKQQVQELRIQYMKELKAKEEQLMVSRQAAASAHTRGAYLCDSCS